jgi:predicted  nucleic acid-binding Zn-ribbon protein
MQGLNQQQRDAVQERTRTLEQTHERIQNRLQNMERELAGSAPNQKRISEEAQLTEREMRSYQNELRRVGDDLGLKTD